MQRKAAPFPDRRDTRQDARRDIRGDGRVADEQLLHLVSQGSVDAYETFYERYAQTAYRLILRIVHDPALADELLQETFWQVWRNAVGYQGTGAAAAWLLRIARNRALDELRRQKARPSIQSVFDPNGEYPETATSSVEMDAEQRWHQTQVQQALAEVPGEQRVCLELAYFDGLTQQEIASQLAVPLGTVKSRMRIGLEKLERLLRRVGYP